MTSMPHLILLGDSIFDNAAYTAGGPSRDRPGQALPRRMAGQPAAGPRRQCTMHPPWLKALLASHKPLTLDQQRAVDLIAAMDDGGIPLNPAC